MIDGRTLDADRLPWLNDEVKPAASASASPLLTWSVAALMLVAGVSYWAGRTADPNSLGRPAPFDKSQTVPLPEPRPETGLAADQPARITPALVPSTAASEPAAPPPAAATRPAAAEHSASGRSAARKASSARKAPARKSASRSAPSKRTSRAAARAAPVAAPVAAWPRPTEAVPLGRIIHLGTYSTPEKNHRAWTSALRRYPQIRNLPKITGAYRAANGRLYYPLYIMTAARQQSEWLCRRLRRDWRSCTIVEA